jgi:hypothetical protein
MRVEIVPDDDVKAHPDIPKDVLEKLGPTSILTNGRMMYCRETLWEKIKDRIPEDANAAAMSAFNALRQR